MRTLLWLCANASEIFSHYSVLLQREESKCSQGLLWTKSVCFHDWCTSDAYRSDWARAHFFFSKSIFSVVNGIFGIHVLTCLDIRHPRRKRCWLKRLDSHWHKSRIGSRIDGKGTEPRRVACEYKETTPTLKNTHIYTLAHTCRTSAHVKSQQTADQLWMDTSFSRPFFRMGVI